MDESRKAFEAEMAKLGDIVDIRRAKNGDEEYMQWDVRLAWKMWQASRAAIEIKWPSHGIDASGGTYHRRDDMRKELSAAGIKVKE